MPQAIQARQQETRILVVDDSELMRRSLRTLLEGQDHWKVCDEASNGQEAVTKFSHKKFDIVVLDFQMPVMDGLEASRQITGRSPGTPILMVTMHASSHLAQESAKGWDSRPLRQGRHQVRRRRDRRPSSGQALFPKLE
jgi:CheY-like chemotaxis protein